MERGGRGKGMKETLASKGRYFAKRPCKTCRASMTTTSWQLVIISQSKSDQNKQSDGAANSVGFQSKEREKFFGLSAQATVRISYCWRNEVLESQAKAWEINVEFVNATLKLSLEQLAVARRLQPGSHQSSENLSIPLKGSECRCTVLAETCRTAGIVVLRAKPGQLLVQSLQ